jgi:hypothetical protein
VTPGIFNDAILRAAIDDLGYRKNPIQFCPTVRCKG